MGLAFTNSRLGTCTDDVNIFIIRLHFYKFVSLFGDRNKRRLKSLFFHRASFVYPPLNLFDFSNFLPAQHEGTKTKIIATYIELFLHGRPIGGVCLYNCNLVLLDSHFSYLFERLLNYSLKSGKVASSV